MNPRIPKIAKAAAKSSLCNLIFSPNILVIKTIIKVFIYSPFFKRKKGASSSLNYHKGQAKFQVGLIELADQPTCENCQANSKYPKNNKFKFVWHIVTSAYYKITGGFFKAFIVPNFPVN